jgi:CelD/BcsL family acetyltransferase involved in cellulose biosynthesis
VKLFELDPLRDSRWTDLVGRSPLSSIFHSPEWLQSLKRTYGYEPVAFVDAGPGEPVNDGLLFCRVSSWITGRRLVSLPFSDHCDPLVEDPARLSAMLRTIASMVGREGRYVELRPLMSYPAIDGFEISEVFCSHAIDLRPGLEQVFARFHKNHIQRTVRKAERSGLTVETGRSANLVREFYALHGLTRQKHGAPIQPIEWFENLVDCLGDRLTIYMARHEGRAAAAILTVVHKTTLVYKYGCSDSAFNRFGGTPLLFWNAIQDGKAHGCTELDLGRSDMDNEGLIAFKDHLGGARTTLNYYRCTGHAPSSTQNGGRTSTLAKQVYGLVPKTLQAKVGRTLYRHFG